MEFKAMLLMNLYDNGFRYIAKEMDGNLYAYRAKPIKSQCCWAIEYVEDCYNLTRFKDLFMGLSWNDKEPFKINNPVEPIDWQKVPVDTKVLTSDNEDGLWYKSYFSEYRPDIFPDSPFITFGGGTTSWNANGAASWKYCKLVNEDD